MDWREMSLSFRIGGSMKGWRSLGGVFELVIVFRLVVVDFAIMRRASAVLKGYLGAHGVMARGTFYLHHT